LGRIQLGRLEKRIFLNKGKREKYSADGATNWYRSEVFASSHEAIFQTKLHRGKGWRLFCSDWREGAVFSPLIYGGSRSPELVEGNAEGAKLPRR
jgi:hypothetical protein